MNKIVGPFGREKVLVGTFSEYYKYQCTSMSIVEDTSAAAAVMTWTVILSTKNS